uniref:SAND domain-containing protein n=1 Tax=Astatotilapia calliptera TaxID=8154 RepID=A0A3P8NEW2_ASTCA
MASSEVNMQEMNEVVIVTLPESGSEDLPSVAEEDKAVLVTAELTPQTGENVLTVAPMEAEAIRADSLAKEDAVIVKLSEEVDVEADVFYPITCGDVKATLIWKKFVCPGINVKCVQFNEQLISPKEFVCLAGKSTLKDWKRAIRLNGTMLRKIMDSGELDFYHHTKVCSNTCRSTKIDLVGTKVSISTDSSDDVIPATPSSADCKSFYKMIWEAGLLEEVVEDFQNELQEVLKGLQERVCDPPLVTALFLNAVLLNNIVQNFGMLDLMDRYREQYTRTLEQQCDEHRKRAKELKSKSQHLNNVLMTLTPVPAPPGPKRPRLTRAVSGPAAVNAAPTQITLPLSQLTSLPLGKVLTVAGAQPSTNVGAYTLLTSSLCGSELSADGSNLTVLSTAAGQEGAAGASSQAASGAFVKLVGPQFQLVTLQGWPPHRAPLSNSSVGTISVVDALAATADDSEEANQAR